MNTLEPSRPYNPDTVSLSTKVERHLRRKGWKKSLRTDQWIDKTDGEAHSFTAAIKIQLKREETHHEKATQTTECQAES